ncbi:multicomponent Na+:H+ antiporter subunit C [Streptomyces sp. Amel2xB2]|uniref:Na(+)/H(+) antiporter subunit C n=1 Tax=Streptomyces sp. Amel2xB2 TaxID=1305829 RepID=UPI000DB9BC5B|nr:Na(+)/H(+) antiporter subunit C [Streptomyces sp. Amel2xB2]RAJ56490.1 multicomponent Na+:H+ antiporter subunit C [Streptomyces sp. Amel2xB2]
MKETLALVGAGGTMIAAGTVLLLSRPLTRIVLGTVVLGNGVNLLLLATSGAASRAPLLYKVFGPQRISDPLPQAFILTAIVITLALTAFLSAMTYRAWQLSGTDDVQDDVEDLRVAYRAEQAEHAERARTARGESRAADEDEDEDTEEPPGEGARSPRSRERRTRRRELIATGEPQPRRAEGTLGRPRRSVARFHEARRRARAETRAHHGRAGRTDEEAAGADPWETILGADR